MEASEPKWVNTALKTIGVNSLMLGGLHITNYNVNSLKQFGYKISKIDKDKNTHCIRTLNITYLHKHTIKLSLMRKNCSLRPSPCSKNRCDVFSK